LKKIEFQQDSQAADLDFARDSERQVSVMGPVGGQKRSPFLASTCCIFDDVGTEKAVWHSSNHRV